MWRPQTRRPRAPSEPTIIWLSRPQKAFCDARTPLVAMVGGRGSGKTTAGAYRLIRRAAPGHTYLVVAPTYTMLRDFAWPKVLELARRLQFLADVSVSRMAIRLGNQAWVLFRTADRPDRLRGLTAAGCWLDEASLVPSEVYEVILFTLREQAGAWLAATFTPKGRRHWTYARFGRGGPDCTLIQAPTRSNPFLPEDFLRLVEREATGRLAAQELEGQFVDLEGAEWPAEYWGDWVYVQASQMPPQEEYLVRVIAVDPSLGRQDRMGDYSAIVCLGVCRGLLWVQADLDRRPPAKIVEDTIRWCHRFRPHAVGIESNQFQQLLVHEFERQSQGRFGLAWPTFKIDNRVPKLVRIRRLGQYITRRELRVLADHSGLELVGQLQDFPHGRHDDGPDALEMAVRLALELSGGHYDEEGLSREPKGPLAGIDRTVEPVV